MYIVKFSWMLTIVDMLERSLHPNWNLGKCDRSRHQMHKMFMNYTTEKRHILPPDNLTLCHCLIYKLSQLIFKSKHSMLCCLKDLCTLNWLVSDTRRQKEYRYGNDCVVRTTIWSCLSDLPASITPDLLLASLCTSEILKKQRGWHEFQLL